LLTGAFRTPSNCAIACSLVGKLAISDNLERSKRSSPKDNPLTSKLEFDFLKSFKIGTILGKKGLIQALTRLTSTGTISHLRRVNTPNDLVMINQRRLHSTQWGIICPVESPDGSNIGIKKHLTMLAHVTFGCDSGPIIDCLRENGILYLNEVIPSHIPSYTKVFVNKFGEENTILISADIENQINQLESEEKINYMKMINLKETGLNKLIKKGYELLELETFFTSGPEESRAWTVSVNCKAPNAAGTIHTDFEKGFIRAETVSYEEFVKNNGWLNSKNNGKMRLEGKDYIVKDGDVLNFRFNTWP